MQGEPSWEVRSHGQTDKSNFEHSLQCMHVWEILSLGCNLCPTSPIRTFAFRTFDGICLIGDWGKQIVPFAGVTAMTADIEVGDMLQSRQKRFPERRDKLVELLQINLKWRMSQVGECKAIGVRQ